MGNTINRVIPYPELTDVANVPADMREMAERIDTLMGSADTGWLPVTISAGFAPHVDPPMMRRIGSVVYVRGGWASTGVIANGTHSVGIFPAAIPRPVIGYYLPAGLATGSATAQFLIGAGGAGTSVQIRNGTAIAGQYYWHGCFTID